MKWWMYVMYEGMHEGMYECFQKYLNCLCLSNSFWSELQAYLFCAFWVTAKHETCVILVVFRLSLCSAAVAHNLQHHWCCLYFRLPHIPLQSFHLRPHHLDLSLHDIDIISLFLGLQRQSIKINNWL